VAILPNEAFIIRLNGAVLCKQKKASQASRRYMLVRVCGRVDKLQINPIFKIYRKGV